jgi:exodeoxyribonuclease VII small subunit
MINDITAAEFGVRGGHSGNQCRQRLKSGFCRTCCYLPLYFQSITAMVKASAKTPVHNLPASYEAAQQELEQLVAQLESGDMPLAQLLASYQRGAGLLKFCRGQLEAVEEQIKVLDAGSLKAWTPE